MDATAPAVAMTPIGAYAADEDTTFLITTTDASGVYACSQMVDAMPGGLGGGTMTQLDDDTWSFVINFAAGTHSIVVSCYDNAGNAGSTSVTAEWTAATEEPAEDFVDEPADVVVDDGGVAADEAAADTGADTDADVGAADDGAATGDEEVDADAEADADTSTSSAAAAGDLIKTACDDTVAVDVNDPCKAVYYFGADGKRHAFPNEKVFFTWFDDFDGVVTITAEDMASMTLGRNVTYHPGTRMVKFLTVNTVYAVGIDGALRPIDSEATATALYGSTWNQQIDDISDAFFGNYAFGDDIVADDEYDRNEVEASVDAVDDIL